jgi:hypothetical protein
LARKIIKQTSSFGVLRANPRISGNVKITVDSDENIWLNSIDSNPEMANQRYKGFRISPDSSYDKDLYSFFSDGSTPQQFVFGLFGENEQIQNQTSDLSESYDFTYSAGVTQLVSNKYQESFSYLAPFWMDKDIPDYFIIFRVNDPIDYSYQIPVTSLVQGNSYKVLQDQTVDENEPGYVPFQISSSSTVYTDGQVFVASSASFSVLQGQGTVILLDPIYNLDAVDDSSTHFIEKILPKSSIVSTFDLSENSKIGKYLRKIQNNANYTDSLVDARFEENQITTFNGVNYQVGIFDKKGDFLLDYYKSPETQIGFENFITDGFRRNGILSYRLLNLEFLFDDEQAQDYTINRYYGLYVNALEMSTFKLDGNSLYQDQGASGNLPLPDRNNKGYYYENLPYFQTNPEGIRIFIDESSITGVIPSSDVVNLLESNKFFWVKDKNNNFYSLKRDENYQSFSPGNPKSIYGLNGSENQLVLKNTTLNLSFFTGEDKRTKKQYGAEFTSERGRAHSVLRIGGEFTLTNQDTLVFYNPLGKYGTVGSKYDLIKTSDLSSVIDEWGPGSYYSQDGVYYFHPFGTNEQIASSLNGIFNSYNYNSFESFHSENEVVIRVKATGILENNKYGFDFYQDFSTLQRMPDSRRGVLFINEKDACDINKKQNFVGGSNYSNTRVKVKLEDLNKIQEGKTFINTNRGSSIVTGKYRFVDQYSREENGEIVGLEDFKTHGILEIENFTEIVSLGSSKKVTAHDTFDVRLGIFSFYGLRELDMDFWESGYGYTPTQEYYKYLDVKPGGTTLIIPGKSYFVSDGAEIIYDGNNINGPEFFEGISGENSYILVTGSTTSESNVYPTLNSRGNISSGVTTSNFDTNFYPDLDSFPGFYGIQSLQFVNTESGLTTKETQLNFGKLNSEYDYTQDNYNPDYTLLSRVSPFITKWVYEKGTDIRGNEYRLNSNLAFGPLNFSPSFFRRSQDPQYFTHEWYHLQKPPYALPEINLHQDKSYLAGEINQLLLSDANPGKRDFFLDYFSIEGEDLDQYYPNSTTINDINLSERYGIFSFNRASGFSETLYRGAKIRIKRPFIDYSQSEFIKYLDDDRFFEDYRFSCVIVPVESVTEKIQPPIKIKILENRTFKNITFIIEVVVDDARLYNFEEISPEQQYLDLDYFLLYSLKDKIKKNFVPTSSAFLPSNFIELPAVGDIKLSSALNITSVVTTGGLFSNVNPGSTDGTGIIYTIPNPNYETDLRDEVSFVYLASTVPSPGSSTGPGSFYGYVGGVGPTGGYTLPFTTGVGQDFLNFTALDSNYLFNFSSVGVSGPVNIPSVVGYTVAQNIPIYQREGGLGYWGSLLEKISFANLSLWVNTGYPYIEYKSYVWDPQTQSTQVLENQFVLEFMKPSAFQQDSLIYPVEISDKPEELELSNIGYNVESLNIQSEMYRYSGSYVPKFKDLLKFSDVKFDYPSWLIPDNFTFFVKVFDKTTESPNYDIGSTQSYYIGEGIYSPSLVTKWTEQKEITLVKGITYLFDLSDSSNLGYQIYFSTSPLGNNIFGDSLSVGYTLFGTPGNIGSYVLLEVPYDWPDDVYYVSQGGKFMGSKIKVVDPIEYLYCNFGPYKDGFGKYKNVNYYKYATSWIFRIGQNSQFNPIYNLIGETPIDKRDLSIFGSSWDPGFYREYTDATSFISIPGTREMKEKKSFFGSKAMKTPQSINSQKQLVYPVSLSDVLNINYENIGDFEIFWEETGTEIRGIILMDRILIRYFLEDGAKRTFQTFIVPEFGFGSLDTVDDDFKEYMQQNILPIYQSQNNGTYLKKIVISPNFNLDPVIGDLADYQKLINEYYPSQEVRYTKINELRYQFRIPKTPSFDYSLAFSIQIGKI